MSSRPSAQRPARRRSPVLPIVLGAIVALGLLAVLVTQRGRGASGTLAAEYRPVQVQGAPLPPMPESETERDPAIGAVAPTLRGQSFTGSPIAIAPGDGQAKLVMFVAHWCPHCQREIGVVENWIKQKGKPASVHLYSVSTAASSSRPNWPPSRWLTQAQWPLPVLVDDKEHGSAAEAYGLGGFPFSVLMDAQGKVVERESGELAQDKLEAMVAQVSPVKS